MKEDIKILEEFKNITFLYGKLAITQEAHKSVSIAIENLIKEFKKIKIENIEYKKGQMPDTTEEYKLLKKELEEWKKI